MKTRGRFAVILLLTCISAPCCAEMVEEAKANLAIALQTYIDSGPRPFVASMLKGGPLENDAQALSQANTLQQIQELAGKPKSFQIVSSNKIAESSATFLFVIQCDKIAIFGNALAYKTPSGVITFTGFFVNTQPDKVWPARRIYGD